MTTAEEKIERVKEIKEVEEIKPLNEKERLLAAWVPKTALGKKVKNGEMTQDQIFEKNLPILEPEIVDSFLELEEKIVDTKKTTRVVRAGRKFSFRIAALVGNHDGYVGLGVAKDVEKFQAATKAARNAKLNLKRVIRGSGSWEEQIQAHSKHSVPFKVTGKCGSVKITLSPAPRGTGLVVGENIKDVFRFCGITDIWSKTSGATDTKLNFIRAAINALEKTTKVRAGPEIMKKIEQSE